MWFNQVAKAPLPDYKKAWFRSKNFRNAISHAIRREDLVKIAFQSLASPAAGPVSPANVFWFNRALKPRAHDPEAAERLLALDGFRKLAGRRVDSTAPAADVPLIT